MTTIRVMSKEDVAQTLTMEKVIETVESVYAAKSKGQTDVWPTVFHLFEKDKADLDIKSGYLREENLYGHKTVSWFGDNEAKGLPALFGMIAVYDGATGEPRGVLDGTYITGVRTGAAGALGAKWLARKDSESLLIVGAGTQATFQIAAMLCLFPSLKTIRVFDRVPAKAQSFIGALPARLSQEFGLQSGSVLFEAVESAEKAVGESDIIITVTSSHAPIIMDAWVRPGTHFSCIGADMEGKQEIESTIMGRARVFVDDKEHCVEVGEIERPIKQGIISAGDIVGELGDLIVGTIEGRTDDGQITVFDATGMALLDIATADSALTMAEERGLGTKANL